MCSCSSVQDRCYKTDKPVIVSGFLSVHISCSCIWVWCHGFSSVGAGGGAYKLRHTDPEAAGRSGSVRALLWTAQRGRLFQGAGKLLSWLDKFLPSFGYINYGLNGTEDDKKLDEITERHRIWWISVKLQPSKIKVQFNVNQKLYMKYATIVEQNVLLRVIIIITIIIMQFIKPLFLKGISHNIAHILIQVLISPVNLCCTAFSNLFKFHLQDL